MSEELSHLDICPGDFSDFLDLTAALPYETPALRGRHYQLHRQSGRSASFLPLLGPATTQPVLIFYLLTDESVSLQHHVSVLSSPLPSPLWSHREYCVCCAGNSDHPLRTGAVTDVNLSSALLSDIVDDLPAFPNDGTDLLPRHQTSQGQVDAGNVPGQLELCAHPRGLEEVARRVISLGCWLGSGSRLD